MVQLGQRVRNAEVVVEERQQLDRRVQGELPLLFLAAGHPDPDHGAVRRFFLDVREVSDDERQQVG